MNEFIFGNNVIDTLQLAGALCMYGYDISLFGHYTWFSFCITSHNDTETRYLYSN